jgi:5'-deoxynucleotidase
LKAKGRVVKNMSKSNFFAVLSRMKLINRWGLMRNTRHENLSEHSYDVAVITHALILLANTRFGAQLDVGRAVLLAMYHDAAEIFTGDMPTPVKYYNDDIRKAYHKVEEISVLRLLKLLPEDLKQSYKPLLIHTESDSRLLLTIKAADKLSALIKCIEEEKAGSSEFKKAALSQEEYLKAMHLPEVDCFLNEFLPGYRLTLDEQKENYDVLLQ